MTLLRLECRRVAHLRFQGREASGRYTTIVCDACATPDLCCLILRRCQINTACWQRHMCVNILPKDAHKSAAAGVEPATCWSQVQRPTTAPPSHIRMCKTHFYILGCPIPVFVAPCDGVQRRQIEAERIDAHSVTVPTVVHPQNRWGSRVETTMLESTDKETAAEEFFFVPTSRQTGSFLSLQHQSGTLYLRTLSRRLLCQLSGDCSRLSSSHGALLM